MRRHDFDNGPASNRLNRRGRRDRSRSHLGTHYGRFRITDPTAISATPTPTEHKRPGQWGSMGSGGGLGTEDRKGGTGSGPVRPAKETGWGALRILGVVQNLNVLATTNQCDGLCPGPRRSAESIVRDQAHRWPCTSADPTVRESLLRGSFGRFVESRQLFSICGRGPSCPTAFGIIGRKVGHCEKCRGGAARCGRLSRSEGAP
jgi:hypothetical protein